MNAHSRPLIVFDMDGTLIDSLPDIADSSRYLLQSYQLPSVNDQTVRSMIGDGIKILVERLLNHAGNTTIDLHEATQRFITYYVDHSTDYSHAFDGTIKCLEEFKKRDWLIALCTNKITSAADLILQQLQLGYYFDIIGGGDRFADKKPNACHLEGVINLLHADPAQTVMVGDHMNDILVAKHAKIAGSIYAAWGYGSSEIGKQATCTANSIIELPDLAEKIIKK
ncbi:HAD family hydrolase [Commensalibacter oyaizuii]|uniref:phosphoglycolate phosphatase n=1 Tax=Commensalibacter oyaizuii TaxID=3043873 RepID=A0ABT6PZN5_9PROT|nr:HAD-IA family hydrolase [Commensalibacter sp. TBRC 16381]MDI2090322.1 HAD-IA family hydrolase [Commensalibacter sp. TBRC 16381]